MKCKSLVLSLLCVAMMSSCEELKNILQEGLNKENTEVQGPEGENGSEDNSSQDDPTEAPVDTIIPIGEIVADGTYTLKGVVVVASPQAYILADDTGAMLVYGSGHGRQGGDVIMVKGTVSRYKGYDTNVLQMAAEDVEVLEDKLAWTSDPITLDASAFDSLVGKEAQCNEVEFRGVLTIDTNDNGTFVNVQVPGAQKKASFKYCSIEEYEGFDGKEVVFVGFVVGTYNYLYVFPLSVTLSSEVQPEPEPEPEPEPTPGCDLISSITAEGEYTVQGTVVAVGYQAYVIADQSGYLLIYGTNHGRSHLDIVKLTGNAHRYQGYETNVFQMKDVTPQVVGKASGWDYRPLNIDGRTLDSMINTKADCIEVQLTGTLKMSGNYANITVDDASKQGSISYMLTSAYTSWDGQRINVKGFLVGTYNYFKILPYSVTLADDTPTGGDPVTPPAYGENDPRGKSWMELPDMTDSSLGYYYHSFAMNGRTYRNYSFGWDDSNKVAYWVAYPLCGLYTYQYAGKNVRHEEYFIKDPLLGNASPRPDKGYAGNYDRGHQVPSADRQCSELANGQTYYGTNMTAQSNPLNGGPWANLENAVRNFANSTDTTYVVSGCYVKNSTEWETDSDGMRIKVPTAYFKAVLVLKNGNWTGGAYWTPHVGYSSSYSSWAISIDELEQKTGLDLYVNLPKKVGASTAASVEAARPGDAKWWN